MLGVINGVLSPAARDGRSPTDGRVDGVQADRGAVETDRERLTATDAQGSSNSRGDHHTPRRIADPGAIYMLTTYATADCDDLTVADWKALARLVTEIEREGGGG